MVLFTHRHTAAGQNQIVVLGRIPQCSNRGFALVGYDAHVCHLTTQTLQHGTQEKAVRVVNRTGRHGLRRNITGHDQLITGREQSHARTRRHCQLTQANAGRQTQFGRRQACAFRKHFGSACDVFSRAANPLRCGHSLVHFDLLVL